MKNVSKASVRVESLYSQLAVLRLPKIMGQGLRIENENAKACLVVGLNAGWIVLDDVGDEHGPFQTQDELFRRLVELLEEVRL